MKKFLSMLLALSVVFTYTFGAAGSVFATAPAGGPTNDAATYLKNVDEAYAQLSKSLTNAVTYVKDNKVGKTTSITYATSKTFDLGKEQMNAAVDAMATLIGDELKVWKSAMYGKTSTDNDGTTYYFDYTVADLKALYTADTGSDYSYEDVFNGRNDIEDLWTDATSYNTSDGTTNYKALDKAAIAQFATTKAALIDGINAIDTTVYSTTKKATVYKSLDGKDYYSVKDYADALVAKLAKTAGDIKLDDDDDTITEVVDVVGAAGGTATTLKGSVLVSAAAANSVKAFYDTTDEVYKLADSNLITVTGETATNAQVESSKQAKLAEMNKNVSDAYVAFAAAHTTTAAATVETANFDKLVNAYKTIVTTAIEALDSTSYSTYSVPKFPNYTIGPKVAEEPYKITEIIGDSTYGESAKTSDYLGAVETLAKVQDLGKTVLASDEYSKTKEIGTSPALNLEGAINAAVADICTYAKDKNGGTSVNGK